MVHHQIAPEAEADLDDIWYYIATSSGSVDIADRLIDALTARFLPACSEPLHRTSPRPRPAPELTHLPGWPIPDFYRLNHDREVAILRVIRGSRDIAALLSH
jgi:plasmid stabilization system protein ParE